jgi:iron complex outermembrane receptor protein
MFRTTHAMPRASRLALALVAALACGAASADDDTHEIGGVTVRGQQPSSLPINIPTTSYGIDGEELRERINAIDAEDALKYFPSLLVRKRYVGDYDHAVLATRASGTGNSARSLVYADGILLSNLLGNGATFTPRWGMVSPEEIERVDVLYGPFSAAYSGNSVGAVVDYVTRMPQRFEAHARLGYAFEDFDLYGRHGRFPARTFSASIGNRWERFSAWLSLSGLDSDAHPIGYATLLKDTGSNSGSGVVVDGAFDARSPREQPWWLVGATGQTDTRQAQGKLKLAYDIGDHRRLSYVLGMWRNDAFRDSQSFLQDADGDPVYSGPVWIEGKRYTLAPTAISLQRADQLQRMQGLSLQQRRGGAFDFNLAASRYDYVQDELRSPLLARPAADEGGAGRIADGRGTGWRTFAAAGAWRPNAQHTVEFGLQQERYKLRTLVSNNGDWLQGEAGTRFSEFGGRTQLSSAFLQDTWRWSPAWNAVLGLRAERWQAKDGLLANATQQFGFPERSETSWSPKAAVEWLASPDWSLKASIGRAVRYPTVSELFQGSISTDAVVNNDPNLKPERATTSELSWIRELEGGHLRATLFHEHTRDALYSQTNATVTPSVTNIQNVGLMRTTGLELALQRRGWLSENFDLDASLTFADSKTVENANFPASEGKWQPRVPRWRANLLATYRAGEHWSFTSGLRYSGKQFNPLDNVDTNGEAWTGVSDFLVADARVVFRPHANWSAALGVDNIGNSTYWNFHPYNQRTWQLEFRFDD